MKLLKALKRLKKKAAKVRFLSRKDRALVIKAVTAATNASELMDAVRHIKLHGQEEHRLVLEKARLFKMDSIGWAVLFEKAEVNSELRSVADDMSYKLSPLYDILKDDDEEDEEEILVGIKSNPI